MSLSSGFLHCSPNPVTPFQLRLAARALRQGGVIAYPTEAVYGLGCDPLDPAAIGRLLHLKERAPAKGLILIAASIEQLLPFIRVDESMLNKLVASWPGPFTWIVPAAPNLPDWISGGRDSVAVRVTAHPLVRDLCQAFGGALISTSANRSGVAPARNPLQVRTRLVGKPDYILHGSLGGLDRPTSIRDARTDQQIRT